MGIIAQIDQTALGIECYVRLYEDHVEIKKPRPRQFREYFERSINIADIESVELKQASGFFANGVIRFCVKDDDRGAVTFFNSSYRDDCMNFKQKFNSAAQDMKNYIDRYIL